MIRKAIRAGMNSLGLGRRMDASAPPSATATLGRARATVPIAADAPRRCATFACVFITVASNKWLLLLDDQRDNEADKRERLDKRGRKDEASEQRALHLRLTSGRGGVAVRRKTNTKAGSDDAETISDDSHDSSFVACPPYAGN